MGDFTKAAILNPIVSHATSAASKKNIIAGQRYLRSLGKQMTRARQMTTPSLMTKFIRMKALAKGNKSVTASCSGIRMVLRVLKGRSMNERKRSATSATLYAQYRVDRRYKRSVRSSMTKLVWFFFTPRFSSIRVDKKIRRVNTPKKNVWATKPKTKKINAAPRRAAGDDGDIVERNEE